MVKSNISDIKSGAFWRAVIGEFLGTALLVLAGCGSCIKDATVERIALGFGLTVASLAWCLSNVSGCHINPAVTIPMVICRKITFIRGLFYIIAQVGGGIVGAGILKGCIHETLRGGLGQTTVNAPITPGQGFGIEFLITFFLVFTVFASCDGARNDLHGSAPLAIGLAVAVGQLFAVPFTGASLNPARSFGPSVVMKNFPHHWVFWVGPICGGTVAGLLYDNIFAADASFSKTKDWLSCKSEAEQPKENGEELKKELKTITAHE